LELLREIVRRRQIIACHGVVKQRSQGAGAERCNFSESIEDGPGFCTLFRVRRLNLQRREIELVEVVLWLLLYSCRKLLFLLGEISFGTGQPARNNVKSGLATMVGEDIIQRFSCEIDLPKAQCR
jgi:hypothetical protein